MVLHTEIKRFLTVIARTSRLVIAGSFPLTHYLEENNCPFHFIHNDIDVFVEQTHYTSSPIKLKSLLQDVADFVGVTAVVRSITSFQVETLVETHVERSHYDNIFHLKGILYLMKVQLYTDGQSIDAPIQFIIMQKQGWRSDWGDFIVERFDISICKCYMHPQYLTVVWHSSVKLDLPIRDYDLEVTVQEFAVIWTRITKYHQRGFRLRSIKWSCSPVWKDYILTSLQSKFTNRFVASMSTGTEINFIIPELYSHIKSFVTPIRPDLIDYLRNNKALLSRFSLDAASPNFLQQLEEIRDSLQRGSIECSDTELQLTKMLDKYKNNCV